MIIYYDEFMEIVSKHKPGEPIYIDGSLYLRGTKITDASRVN